MLLLRTLFGKPCSTVSTTFQKSTALPSITDCGRRCCSAQSYPISCTSDVRRTKLNALTAEFGRTGRRHLHPSRGPPPFSTRRAPSDTNTRSNSVAEPPPSKPSHPFIYDELITSREIMLLAVDGKEIGVKPTAFVLGRKKAQLSILQVRPALPDGTPAVARLIPRSELIAKIEAHEKKIAERERVARLTEPKEKVYKLAPGIAEGDLKHKMKHMVDVLEKGDKVRVFVTAKVKRKSGKGASNDDAPVVALKDKIVEHLLEVGTVISETVKSSTAEIGVNPKVTKLAIYKQKLKEKESAEKKEKDAA